MDEKSSQIIGEIETTRDKLGDNLSALESRMREATDWRTYYDRHPFVFIGAAIGGGLLASKILSGGSGSNGGSGHTHSYSSSEPGPAGEILNKVKSALVVYGAAKAKEILGEILPGFSEHVHNL